MNKILLTLACVLGLSLAARAGQITVTFATGTNADGTEINTSTPISDIVSEGAEIFSKVKDANYAYCGSTNGLKVGARYVGNLKLSLTEPLQIKSIVTNALSYGTNTECTVQPLCYNGSKQYLADPLYYEITNSATDYTFTYEEPITVDTVEFAL